MITFTWIKCDAINRVNPTFKCSLVNPPTTLGHGWLITFYINNRWRRDFIMCIDENIQYTQGEITGKLIRCTRKYCMPSLVILNDNVWSAKTYQGGNFHDDVIEWKHFPRHWLFVRGIHRSLVNSPHKGQWRCALMFSLVCLNKRLSKPSWRRWFETLSRSLWRHCNEWLHTFCQMKTHLIFSERCVCWVPHTLRIRRLT